MKKNYKHIKSIIFIGILLFFSIKVNAQKGLFVKVSLGSGYTTENSKLNSSAFSIVTKNHAIGWGITEKFAVQIGEFGSLIKQKNGNYNYINLDAFGVGISYRLPHQIKVSSLGTYSMVSYAKKWSESTGVNKGKGFGVNLSVEKEWFLGKRWGFRLGPQIFWIKTTDTNYFFFNVSLNAGIVFYLKPLQ